jgi:hypothetical protein
MRSKQKEKNGRKRPAMKTVAVRGDVAAFDGGFIPPYFFLCFWLDSNRPTPRAGGAAALRTPPLERGLAINAGRLCAPGE